MCHVPSILDVPPQLNPPVATIIVKLHIVRGGRGGKVFSPANEHDFAGTKFPTVYINHMEKGVVGGLFSGTDKLN